MGLHIFLKMMIANGLAYEYGSQICKNICLDKSHQDLN